MRRVGRLVPAGSPTTSPTDSQTDSEEQPWRRSDSIPGAALRRSPGFPAANSTNLGCSQSAMTRRSGSASHLCSRRVPNARASAMAQSTRLSASATIARRSASSAATCSRQAAQGAEADPSVRPQRKAAQAWAATWTALAVVGWTACLPACERLTSGCALKPGGTLQMAWPTRCRVVRGSPVGSWQGSPSDQERATDCVQHHHQQAATPTPHQWRFCRNLLA